jgi:serine/threonine protein kinase
MGEVYRALDTRLNRTVAVKVLRDWANASADARQRVEREARAVSCLNHPRIGTLFDVARDDEESCPSLHGAACDFRGR